MASIVLKLLAAIALFFALARHSYDYYTLLRWFVCAVSVFSTLQALQRKSTGWVVAFVVVALMFNPFAPVHLKRETWAFVDVVVGVLFLVSIGFVDRTTRKESDEREH